MFKFSAVQLNTQCPGAAVPGRHVPSSTLKERGTNTTRLVASKVCVAKAKNSSPGVPTIRMPYARGPHHSADCQQVRFRRCKRGEQ